MTISNTPVFNISVNTFLESSTGDEKNLNMTMGISLLENQN